MEKKLLFAIDVGTTKVCTLVAELENEDCMHIKGVGVEPMVGMKKGLLVDMESASQAIQRSIHKAERTSGEEIEHAYVNLSGSQITSIINHAAVGIAGGKIDQSDIERVRASVKAIPIESNRTIVLTIARDFCVDGTPGVRHPLNMFASRLDMDAHVITASTSSVQNMRQCVMSAETDVDDFVLNALADAEVVLNDIEKQMGVVVCDIGGGTTDLAIYINGEVWHTNVLPVGGNQITGDISQRFHLPWDQAEEVKRVHGICMPDYVNADEYFYSRTFDRGEAARFSRKELAEIINMRVEEIFQMILEEVKRSGYDNLLPAGMVLTGGSALLPGIDLLGASVLNMPVRVGKPENMTGMIDQLDSPAYATGIGLLYWPVRMFGESEEKGSAAPEKKGFLRKAYGILRDLMP